MGKYQKLDFSGVKTYELSDRESKVSTDDFASAVDNNPDFAKFLESLPKILSGKDFLDFIDAYIQSVKEKSAQVLMMGAHVIKVGLAPVLIDAMKNGWISR